MNVQTVFNGIVAALNDAVANGLSLGGLTPDNGCMLSPHICARR